MSRAAVAIVLLATLALAGSALPLRAGADSVAVGQSVPPFAIDTLDGRSVTADFHGKPAYINVFATWCPPCRRELPSIVVLTQRYGDRISTLLVDEQEPASKVRTFLAGFGLDRGIAVDRGQFAATFGVVGLPESIFIDRRGIVRDIYRGAIPPAVLAEKLSLLGAAAPASH